MQTGYTKLLLIHPHMTAERTGISNMYAATLLHIM